MINEVKLKDGERVDDLERNGYGIIQNPEKFCFGIDAVLLSDFAKAKENEVVIDLGTGTGIIPILMEAKTNARLFKALEIQKDSVNMAKRSIKMNGQTDKIEIIHGDIKEASDIFDNGVFDVVTTNPPYMVGSGGIVNPDKPKAIARHEILCTLDDVIKQGSKLLKTNGRMYMVHRPSRLVDIFATFTKYKLEPKRMRLVYPYVDKEPNMVLIEAIKGAKSMIKVERPLVVYKSVGQYTDEIYDIYGYEKK